mmetsp:Transcript_50040/g.144087  ORF Transcript_50040/g.144087 Transcript_50040/m.144087 type:complete len:280 (+) Transcript_50040:143-982(+)
MYGSTAARPPVSHKSFGSRELVQLVVWPLAVVGVVFLLFANVFHRAESFVLFAVVLGATVSAGFICAANGDTFRMTKFAFCFAAWGLSAFVGLMSHDLALSHYWFLHESNAYANVFPTETAAGFADAGKLSFADGASVDSARSLGYKDVSTFCVAPIIDQMQAPLIQFWAIGVNCCDARGGFQCDGASSPKARSGIVVHDVTGEYAAAIKMAEAVYNLASAQKYLLVRWVEDPEAVEMNYWHVGIAVLMAGMLVFAILFALSAFGVDIAMRGHTSLFFR